MLDFRRRLRGTIRNAAVWGIGWTVLGFATQMVLRITGIIDAPVSVQDAALVALKVGIGGGIAGAAFSAYIAFAYRNRRIQSINWLKFGAGGALVTTASITAFAQGASLLGGSGLVPWHYMGSTTALFAVFGFSAAAVSMKLAQLATSRAPDSEHGLLREEQGGHLTSGAGALPLQQRARAEVHVRRD